MQLKKAKTPRKKKQGSVKRASIKRRVSVRRGGSRSSRSALRSKSSRRLIRGGGRKTNIALGTGIAAIGGSYAAKYYLHQKINKWYKNKFRPNWERGVVYISLEGIGKSKIQDCLEKLQEIDINKFLCIHQITNSPLYYDLFATEFDKAKERISTSGAGAGASAGVVRCSIEIDEEFILYCIMVGAYNKDMVAN